MELHLDPRDFEGLVRHLGDEVRARQAFRLLVRAGPDALPAVREGLGHPSAEVRLHCVRALDHLVDGQAWPSLIACLRDEDPRVRNQALHAIACDRCKQGERGPDKDDVLPRAIELLKGDPSYHVRAMAIEVVGLFVHQDLAAATALATAHADDGSPVVRKKAGWYAPGGVIHARTAPSP